MTAAPASIATAIQAVPAGISPPGATGATAAAPAGGLAFLALLDQMLGLAPGGQTKPAIDGEVPPPAARPVGQRGPDQLPAWLLPYAVEESAAKPAAAPQPAIPPAVVEALEAVYGDITPDGTKPVPDLPDGADAGGPAVGTTAAATDTAPQAPAPAIAAAPQPAPPDTAAEAALAADPPAEVPAISSRLRRILPQLPARPAEMAQAAADTTSDPALDGVFAAFARRPAPASVPSRATTQPPALTTDQPAVPAEAIAGTVRKQAAGKEQAAETDRAPARSADARIGDARPADALDRLLAAAQVGRGALKAHGGPAGTTESAGARDIAAPKPVSVSPVLLTVNEVGVAAPGPAVAAGATLAATAKAGVPARPDIDSLALRIAHEARGGAQSFEIELDPPELGRVEVRLEFGRDGRLTTHLLVDRNDTLDALARDARGLERALQAHGLKLDDGGLQYQLRDQPSFAQHQREQAADRADASPDDPNPLSGAEPEPPAIRRRLVLGGLDLTI